eukprot:maker-scaffold959_size76551-snap-gene-0.21 protein:Tk01216 transcript:maker-scaffold959_size76551-snap-gene-0.21-mRNA-1 annotation:"poly rna polymerase gld2-a"
MLADTRITMLADTRITMLADTRITMLADTSITMLADTRITILADTRITILADTRITILADTSQASPPSESRVGKYLSLSTTIQMDLPPCAWEESSKQSQLSTDMARFFLANRQDPEFFRKKIELWASLEDLVSKTFPGGFAQVFGSTLNGFGSSSSDMDMCIFLITNGVEDQSQLHRLEFIKQSLFRLRRVIKKDLGHRILPDIEMIPAKVPILKLHDGLSDVSIDISCNHPIGVRNTHLLYHYSQ